MWKHEALSIGISMLDFELDPRVDSVFNKGEWSKGWSLGGLAEQANEGRKTQVSVIP